MPTSTGTTPIGTIINFIAEPITAAALPIPAENLNSDLKSSPDTSSVADFIVYAIRAFNENDYSKAKDQIALIRGLIDPKLDAKIQGNHDLGYVIIQLLGLVLTDANGHYAIDNANFHVINGDDDAATICYQEFDDEHCDAIGYLQLQADHPNGVIYLGTAGAMVEFLDYVVELVDAAQAPDEEGW